MGASAILPTPIGPLRIVHDGDSLLGAAFAADEPESSPPPPARIADAFAAYFDGSPALLAHLPRRPRGTEFQLRVWAALERIGHGETRSYADIARALGGRAMGPGGLARAIGAANARNPIAIAIPCHRVIGAGGSLTGYAGGLERKLWLLRHEGAVTGPLL